MSITQEIHQIFTWASGLIGITWPTSVASQDTLNIVNEHIHSPQQVAPALGNNIAVASAVGAWTLGNFSADLIAAGAIAMDFDIHHMDIIVNNNAQFEIRLYYGPGDIFCGAISAERINATNRSAQIKLITGTTTHTPIPAGSRVRARCADSVGGGSVNIKIHYHTY